jgi:hypothetical protein
MQGCAMLAVTTTIRDDYCVADGTTRWCSRGSGSALKTSTGTTTQAGASCSAVQRTSLISEWMQRNLRGDLRDERGSLVASFEFPPTHPFCSTP